MKVVNQQRASSNYIGYTDTLDGKKVGLSLVTGVTTIDGWRFARKEEDALTSGLVSRPGGVAGGENIVGLK